MAPYGEPRYLDKVYKLIDVSRDGSFLSEHIVGIDLHSLGFIYERLANGVTKPLQRAAGGERDAHHVPFAAHGMAERVQPALWIDLRRFRVNENNA